MDGVSARPKSAPTQLVLARAGAGEAVCGGPGLHFLVLGLGLLLFAFLSDHFVLYSSGPYVKVACWSTLGFTPLVLYGIRRNTSITQQLTSKYPTAWPGATVHPVPATALEVGAYVRRRRGCDQTATLRFASVDSMTCLDRLFPAGAMQAGQVLDVGITVVPFGFRIKLIAASDQTVQVMQ